MVGQLKILSLAGMKGLKECPQDGRSCASLTVNMVCVSIELNSQHRFVCRSSFKQVNNTYFIRVITTGQIVLQ